MQLAGAPAVRGLVNRGFRGDARRRMARLAAFDPVRMQERTLLRLVHQARRTRFGRDHGFAALRSVADYQRAVPLRTYEDIWQLYFRDRYPVFDDLTWPGRIPYLALTSGTTQGATKYIPVSRAMLASNRKAARTMVAAHLAGRRDSRLFHGRMFFLGGSSALERPDPGADVEQGDLSGIVSKELHELLRPYTFPPLELALEPDWDRKLARLAQRSLHEPITLVGGVPSWLLALFRRVLEESGKSTVAEVWPMLEMVVHGGVKFDPYRATFEAILGSPRVRLQETYPCSEGFIAFGDHETGLLRPVLDHGLFYEFVPADELESPRPTRHWLGDVQLGVNYAIVLSTCAGLWAHIVGDTVRFESASPPLLSFTGRTRYTLSAFGEHLINEEIEAAVAAAARGTSTSVRDWHVGPVFQGAMGYHLYVVEFLEPPPQAVTAAPLHAFRRTLDAELSRRNADYAAHRAEGVGLPLPALVVARPGAFEGWMRARGKLGGQHKVPRMDGAGTLTSELVAFLRETDQVACDVPAGAPAPA
jgi:hypothetical protein